MWSFKLPTEIIFGQGTSSKIKELTGRFGAKIIVVTDNNLRGIPAIKNIIELIEPQAVFTDVTPNPTTENVNRLVELLDGADAIVSIGGGSAIDCAKAASCLARSKDKLISEYHSGGKQFSVTDGSIPLIAIPTTAGTGSEVTPFAVLDDPERNFKGPIACDMFYPKLTLVDPELTVTAPKHVTAATALDALSHSIEGYWSKKHQPICDLFALEAASKIFANLGKIYERPNDCAAREALSYAALLAGMAFQLPKNAIIHACSFPLSNRYHLPHGVACAFTMEGAIKLNAPFMNGRMDAFAQYCGFATVKQMIGKISELKFRGGLPLNLADAKIPCEAVDELIEASFHPLMNNNPKDVTVADLRKIYQELGA